LKSVPFDFYSGISNHPGDEVSMVNMFACLAMNWRYEKKHHMNKIMYKLSP